MPTRTKTQQTEEIAKIAAAAAAAVLANDIHHIQIDLLDIKTKLDNLYITKSEFDPVKKVVYGLVGIILIAVAGGLLSLVIKAK